MKMRRRVAVCVVTLAALSGRGVAQSSPEPTIGAAKPAPHFVAGKPELGRAYLEMERAVLDKAGTLEATTLASINRGFDQAAFFYFQGDYKEAVREIDQQIERVRGSSGWIRTLTLRPSSSVVRCGHDATVIVKIMPICRWPRPEKCEIGLALAAGDAPDAEIRDAGRTTLDAEGRGEASLRLDSAAPARWRVFVCDAAHPGEKIEACSVYATTESFDSERESLLRRLDAVEAGHAAMAHAIGACRARARLLTDKPSPDNTYLVRNSLLALAEAVRDEVAALESGRDPYRHATGDYWLTLKIAGMDEPSRLFVPSVPEGSTPGPRPLIIAAHGAGGDENLWMDGYGAGILPREAAKRGMLVLSVRVGLGTFMPATLDGLIDGVARWHEVDRSRVYAIGHSMGGGVVTAWAKQRADHLAGVVSIAGIGMFGGGGSTAPTLAYAAAEDGLITAARIRGSAEAAKTAGLPVEYREIANYGHLLVVGKVVPEALDWLLEHRLPTHSPSGSAPADPSANPAAPSPTPNRNP